MSVSTAPLTWVEGNRRYLNDLIAALHQRVDACALGEGLPEAVVDAEPAVLDPPPVLETLSVAFGLSRFERHVLAMCAAVELDARFAQACAAVPNGSGRPHVTFDLALAVVPDGHWDALSPSGPLRHWRLVELGPGDSLATRALRIDERVLHHLTGVAYLDDRLVGLVQPAGAIDDLPSSHRAVARRVADVWAGRHGPPWPVIQLSGPGHGTKSAVAHVACHELGFELLQLPAENVPAAAGERAALALLCERETVLSSSALLLLVDRDSPVEDVVDRATRFAKDMGGPLLIAASEPLALDGKASARLEVERLDPAEQRRAWRRALGAAGPAVDSRLDELVNQFDLDRAGIQAAVETATVDGDGGGFERLWEACRVQARRRLDDLAQRVRSTVGWDDLVLPAAPRETLSEIALHVRHSRKVYDTWGFAARSDRGLGITALFAGPSGTGKTLAAEVLANELHLDLYRIDLSQVVSKYIGETEKNLRRIFEAAERSGAVLLFDEADALFGKRSEVRDSHDRYANIEVGYLLQRMEAYRGLAILTTNVRNALDPAFLRRIRFVVQFPFPDAAQREQIWRRVFPTQTPTEALDATRLARLSIAGGNIRNIAMNAAFLAADEGAPVRMAHVLRAARNEYGKLEKSLTASELAGLA